MVTQEMHPANEGAYAAKSQVKVVFIHDTITYGGLEVYLLRFLRSLDRGLYQPYVLVPGYTDQYRSSPQQFIDEVNELNVPVLRPNHPGDTKGLSAIHDIVNIRRLLCDVRADVVHIHTCRPEGARKATLGAQAARVPLILRTEHCSPILFGDPSTNKLLMRVFDRLTDKLFTVSENNRLEQIEIFGRSPTKVTTSYTGIEPDHFDPEHDVAEAKEELGLSPHTPVVGAVGRLTKVKGFSYLIEAARQVLDNYGPTNFLLVGGGPLKKQLMQEIEAANIGKYFHLVGYKSNPVPYIKAMDVTVMPSLSEGFPLSLLEYMALGKPSVVTDYPTIREAVANDEHCIIVPMRNADALAEGIMELLRNPERAQVMGASLRNRVETNFDFQDHVDELTNMYLAAAKKYWVSRNSGG